MVATTDRTERTDDEIALAAFDDVQIAHLYLLYFIPCVVSRASCI
jgi:hypothetical protein